MRCPDCNKFVSLECLEPEADTPDVELCEEGVKLTTSVRLARACADCGTELKETTFEFDETLPLTAEQVAAHVGHDLDTDEASAEATESGGGRYKKNMIGVEVVYDITCTTCKLSLGSVALQDECPASAFDEMV